MSRKRLSRNRFKYICSECGAMRFITRIERNSRFRPRCTSCGSAALDPSPASIGPERLAVAETERNTQRLARDQQQNKGKEAT